MAQQLIVFALVFGTAFAGLVLEPDDNIDWRIVGGSPAGVGQYPYQVSLRTPQNRHFCGGSIISPNWILTAAHCINGQAASSVVVVVGTNYLNSGGVSHRVAQVIGHEGYNSQSNVNDVAVLRLASTISYNNVVQPIGLASSATPGGASCVLSGWGLTSYPSNNIPNSLQHISLSSISVAQCQQALPGYPVYASNVCTREPSGRGACQGDSGGPLLCNGVQAGVVSWGIPCAKGNPDIFASVASFRQWIRSKTGL